jgi:hypothetical protein
VALDVFIGYSRVDLEAAEAIQQYLSSEGFDCYRDITNIPGSDEWVKAITQAIRACHVYVTLVSRNSIESEHVGLELTFGKKHKKPFVPVFLSRDFLLTDEVDFFLGNRQYIYAEPPLEAALPKIADAVRRTLTVPSTRRLTKMKPACGRAQRTAAKWTLLATHWDCQWGNSGRALPRLVDGRMCSLPSPASMWGAS